MNKINLVKYSLTVVLIIPVPCIRIELLICLIFIVFKYLLVLLFSINIWLLKLYEYLDTNIFKFLIISSKSKP